VNFRCAHASLAPLDVRELDFLAGILACRIERLLEPDEDEREPEEPKPELRLAA